MIGLANLLLAKSRRPFLIGFFILYAVKEVFLFIGGSLPWEQSIVINTVFVIPFLVLYLSFWSENYCKFAFLLRFLSFPIRQVRIVVIAFRADLYSIMTELGDMAGEAINLLGIIANLLSVLEYLLLILWFWKVFKTMQLGVVIPGKAVAPSPAVTAARTAPTTRKIVTTGYQ